MIELILVRRLKQIYWPKWCTQLTLDRVQRAEPRGYEPPTHRDVRYDAGRVHYLLRELRRRQSLDPVELETTWNGHSPVGTVMLDGHHRFVATVLAHKRRIPVDVGGLVLVRDWLVGGPEQYPL